MTVGKTPSVPLKGEAMGVMYVRNIGVGGLAMLEPAAQVLWPRRS